MSQPMDCCGAGDPRDLSVDQARERIAAGLPSPAGIEQLPLRSALGRVLAESVISPLDVPGQDNSAMDGYAVRSADLPADGERRLQLIGTALAGGAWDRVLEPGQCLRIMTGAVMPPGADSVIMQERAERKGDQVRIGPGHRVGENVRRAGEDIARGASVLPAGRRLRPADLGLLASLGLAEVRVRRRLRVAFFSTGDELRSIGGSITVGAEDMATIRAEVLAAAASISEVSAMFISMLRLIGPLGSWMSNAMISDGHTKVKSRG